MRPGEVFLLPFSGVAEAGVVLLLCVVIGATARRERKAAAIVFLLYTASLVLRSLAVFAGGYGQARIASVLTLLGHVLTGVVLLNLARLLIFAVLLRALRLEPPRLARDLVLGLGYIGLVLYLFSIYKIDVTGIIATSAVLTAIVGFSMQDVLGNVMSGVALQLDRSISPGDLVKVGDVEGFVTDISWRRVSIQSLDGDLYIVPNSKFLQNEVLIEGKRHGGGVRQRRSVSFSVDGQHAPARVLSAVADSLERGGGMQNVANDPKPDVILSGFDGSSVQYAVRYWLTDLGSGSGTDSVIRSRIFYALRRARIPIASSSDAAPAGDERAKAIRSVTLFSRLTDSEIDRVADRLMYAPFLHGENIIVQGGPVNHLYILTRGTVEVRLSVNGGPMKAITTIAAPSFFGEMGMLTGEPRRATIAAIEEVECWRLERDGFREILEGRPELADEISVALAERLAENQAAREGLTEEAKRQRMQSERQSLVTRIYSFFNLEEA